MSVGDTTITIANKALAAMGTRTNIASLAEQSNEAIQINLIFTSIRDALLRMAPWNCAFNFLPLSLITATPGTPENTSVAAVQWNKTMPAPPWAYEYAYPSDCLRACYVVPQFQTGFASGIPITTAITGGAPSFWQGPPARFRIATDQPITILTAAIASAGLGYAVGDNITLGVGSGFTGTLQVSSVGALGAITGVSIFISGSYLLPTPSNPVAQTGTTGAGSGATFNLTFSGAVDQTVILTNQEFAILAYVKAIANPAIWDPLFTEAMVHTLAARVVYALSGDKGLANERLKTANEQIMIARTGDGNEGITINDVTPDFIRIRGITYPTDFGWTPNINFDWGQTLTMY
jgi:hypothetical protein